MIRDFKLADTEELYNLVNNVDTGYEIDDIKEIQANAFKLFIKKLILKG